MLDFDEGGGGVLCELPDFEQAPKIKTWNIEKMRIKIRFDTAISPSTKAQEYTQGLHKSPVMI